MDPMTLIGIVSVLADIIMGGITSSDQEAALEEQEKYRKRMERIQEKEREERRRTARRGALANAIGADVSLGMPEPYSPYPMKPSAYEYPSWYTTGTGITSGARQLMPYFSSLSTQGSTKEDKGYKPGRTPDYSKIADEYDYTKLYV